MQFVRTAPAILRRAFFVLCCVAADLAVAAGPGAQPPPPLRQPGKLDPAEGKAALEELRRQGITGNYYLEFELRIMPRRGDERRVRGRLWGGNNEIGPLTRVSFLPETGDARTAARRLLIQNGPKSAVWRWDADKGVEMLGVASLFEPLVPNTELTAFDLQMPFIYWNDFTYEGLVRFRGRPARVLVLRPPADFAAKHPALTAVRVRLDTQFNALVQTELIGPNGAVAKTISLVDLKKIDEQWIPKTFDVRDETTRNKTRLSVTAAALGLEFSRALFEPARLSDEIQPPAGDRLEHLTP